MSRRRFIGCALAAAGGIYGWRYLDSPLDGLSVLDPSRSAQAQDVMEKAISGGVAEASERFVAEAKYYEKLEELKVRCTLCPRECVVADRERGYCGVRENRGGEYKTLVYGRLVSLNLDPIEKKPLFHFLPGTTALSLATAGCNMECKFCQNWQISQYRPEQVRSTYGSPADVVAAAGKEKSPTIAFTYSEPVIFYEYMLDIAREAQAVGIFSVMISNGYIKRDALRELCRHLTAIKVDLKAFTEKFYRETCSGELGPVLDALIEMKACGKWVELVVLIVPTLNDSEAEIRRMAQWVVKNLGPDVPMHFTRFHPEYKITNLPRTPIKTLEQCREVAMGEGVHYVYSGNVPGHPGENTYCPACGEEVVTRTGYFARSRVTDAGACPKCGATLAGIWNRGMALSAAASTPAI